MSDNVIKFGKAKKSLARKGKEKRAAINRARFGQKKSAKEVKKALAEKLQAKLDAHKIEGAADSPKLSNIKPDEKSD